MRTVMGENGPKFGSPLQRGARHCQIGLGPVRAVMLEARLADAAPPKLKNG